MLETFQSTMHGTSGQYRLDMKRDDARTLMLKMDARLTFAGRERNVVVQLEGERQMKHIEWQRQVNQNEFKRQEKKVRRRMEFFQALAEENKMARQTLESDMNVFETEIQADKEATRQRGRKLLPMPAKRKVQNLYQPENVGSVRREQRSFTNNRAHERFLNRSLNELNNSYKKQQSQKEINEAKLKKIREEISTIGRPKPSQEATQPTLEGVPELQVSTGEPTTSRSKRQSQEHTKSLPHLPKVQEEHLTPEGRKLSMSQKIAGNDFARLGKLPGISVSDTNTGNRSNLGGNFYIDTSHSQSAVNKRRGSIQLVTLNKPKPKPKKKEKPVTGPRLLAGAIPKHYYEGVYEENPFLTPDFKPEAVRVRSKSGKSDEMYAWLGLDSMEELVLLRGEDGIGIGKDVEEEDMEWLEIASNEDEESNPDTSERGEISEKKKREKVVYTIDGKPAEFYKVKGRPLKKFAMAAKSIMLIRRIQDSAGCLPETATVIVRKEPNEQPANPEANKGTGDQPEENTTDKQNGGTTAITNDEAEI